MTPTFVISPKPYAELIASVLRPTFAGTTSETRVDDEAVEKSWIMAAIC